MPNESPFNFWLSITNRIFAKFLLWSYWPKCYWPMNLQDSLKCNISEKNWEIKLIFFVQIKIRVFYKCCAVLLPKKGLAKHGQMCPKYPKKQFCSIFVIFQERVQGKYDFLHGDKHESFLRAGTTIFSGHS